MKRTIILLLVCISLQAAAQYTTTVMVPGLNTPVAFALTPDGRFFVNLKSGLIQSYNQSGTLISTMYDLSDSTWNYGECGLLGICLDPDFSSNHFFYVYYTHYDSAAAAPGPRVRVLRFEEQNNTAINPLLILDVAQANPNHVGGNIHFSNSSNTELYVTIGENTVQANAQMLTNPFGKILRINSDGTIPAGNPFYDDGNPSTGNDDRIWAYGLRNSFDFTFSPLNDTLYATENGPAWDDEINIIHKGSNYAWPIHTGYNFNPAFADPIYTWTPTIAPTGILFYSDTTFPQFDNHLLVAIFANGYIYDLTLGNAPYYDTVIASSIAFNYGTGFANYITTLLKGADGCIYVLHGGPAGFIDRICPGPIGISEPVEGIEKIFPVPANDFVEVSCRFKGPGELTFKIYDLYGRLVKEVKHQAIPEGGQPVRISLAGLTNGVYLLKAEKDNTNFSGTAKIVLTR